jgi:hypothetical protein
MPLIKLKSLIIFFIVTLPFITISCSHTQVHSTMRFVQPKDGSSSIGLEKLREARKRFADIDKDDLKSNFPKERSFNRNIEKPPELGLALSGGGTRSASFSIGVLKALHKRGILQNVDVMSSVSGGSYALYWYFMQHYNMEKACEEMRQISPLSTLSSEDLFRTEESEGNTVYQSHLEDRSDILVLGNPDEKQRGFYNPASQVLKFFTVLPSIPLNLIGNFLFDWDLNLNPYRGYYQNGIERAYGLTPVPTKKDGSKENDSLKYINGKWNIGDLPINAEEVTFADMRKFLEKRRNASSSAVNLFPCSFPRTKKLDKRLNVPRLPFFVVNATASHGRIGSLYDVNENVDVPPSQRKTATPNRIFEFTPLGFGSEVFGYGTFDENGEGKNLNEEIYFSKAVSASGAAVDTQFFSRTGIIGTTATYISRGLNLNIGYTMDNYNVSWDQVVTNNFIGWPLYILDNSVMSRKRNYENQRGVDVEEDRRFHLPSKHSTKIYLSDGGMSENLGVLSLVRRKVKNIIFVDAEMDNNKCGKFACFEGLNLLEKSLAKDYGLKLEMTGLGRQTFDIRDAKVSVFKGKIKGFLEKPLELNLTYIKLSYDQKDLKKYPSGLQTWVKYGTNEIKEKTEKQKTEIFSRCKVINSHDELKKSYIEGNLKNIEIDKSCKKSKNFPHVSTADVFFQERQVKAYRDLGYHIVCNQGFDNFNNTLTNRDIDKTYKCDEEFKKAK